MGPETVKTVPLATLEAFRDHGRVRGATVSEERGGAEQRLESLTALGIDLNAVAEQLQIEGIELFGASYTKVVAALERKREAIVPMAH